MPFTTGFDSIDMIDGFDIGLVVVTFSPAMELFVLVPVPDTNGFVVVLLATDFDSDTTVCFGSCFTAGFGAVTGFVIFVCCVFDCIPFVSSETSSSVSICESICENADFCVCYLNYLILLFYYYSYTKLIVKLQILIYL